MPENPRYDEYTPEHLAQVLKACRHVSRVLGSLMEDVVVVGGLAPYLLIDVPSGTTDDPDLGHHVGTMDVDLGLSLAVFG